MVVFSKSLIEEYQSEMAHSYGVLVSDEDAQIQLLRLTRSMFPIAIAEEIAGSRERSARSCGTPPCARSLADRLGEGDGNEVEASITSTSGHGTK